MEPQSGCYAVHRSRMECGRLLHHLMIPAGQRIGELRGMIVVMLRCATKVPCYDYSN